MPSLRKKKSKSDDDSVASSSSGMSRSKRMKKSLKGFIKRKSKKKSDVRPSVASVPEGTSLEIDDKEKKDGADDATEYGVEIDKSVKADSPVKEVSTGSPSPVSPADALRLVLLLLDPYSRRFELLQLEFDAKRAHVSDVLDQIPLTATEKDLRDKKYTGLCSRDGVEMKEGLLSECEYEDGVLVAIPEGLTSKQCAQLAKPILFDPKVLATFKTSPSKEQAAPPLVEETPEPEAAEPEKTEAPEPPKQEERSLPVADPVKEKKAGSSFLSRFLLLAFLIAALSPVLVLLQKRHTAPMSPGDVLSPGEWKSTCGVLSFISLLPPKVIELSQGVLEECSQGVLEMGQDGVLTYSEANETKWSLTGGVCEADDEECIPGAVFTESRTLRIGGKEVSDALPEGWPFTKEVEEPEEDQQE